MKRDEFPVGRPGWEQTIIDEGLTYSVDGPHDLQHYWNEYAAYVFTPVEMTNLRDQAREVHQMCLHAIERMASGAYGTLGLPEAAFNMAKESWNRHEPDFYGRFDFIYSGVPGDRLKLLEYNADTPTGIVEAAISQKTWASDQRLDTRGYVHWGEIGEAFTERWRQMFAHDLSHGRSPRLHLASVTEEIDVNDEDYNNLWLIAHAANRAGLTTKLIRIDEVIFDETLKIWKDPEGERIENLFKLYPWEDMVTDSESGYDKLLFAYHDMMNRWIEPAWKMFLSNKILLAALWDLYPNHPNLLETHVGMRGGLKNWVRKPIALRSMLPIMMSLCVMRTMTTLSTYLKANLCIRILLPRRCTRGLLTALTCRCWASGWSMARRSVWAFANRTGLSPTTNVVSPRISYRSNRTLFRSRCTAFNHTKTRTLCCIFIGLCTIRSKIYGF